MNRSKYQTIANAIQGHVKKLKFKQFLLGSFHFQSRCYIAKKLEKQSDITYTKIKQRALFHENMLSNITNTIKFSTSQLAI